MRKFLIVLLILITLSGCGLLKKNQEDIEDTDMFFSPEKIIYLKTFEQLEPGVAILDDNSERTLININCGLTDYTEISINNIEQKKDSYVISISGKKDNSGRLSTPIITLSVYKGENSPVSPKFTVDVSRIETYKLNLSLSELLKSLESNLHYCAKTIPDVALINNQDGLRWNLNYKSAMDTESERLINLNLVVDADSGKAVSVKKSYLSDKIAEGSIIGLVEGRYLYYKNEKQNEKEKLTEVFLYDIKTRKSSGVYQTVAEDFKIRIFSKDRIAIIDKSNVFLYENSKWTMLPPLTEGKDNKSILTPTSLIFSEDGNLYVMVENTAKKTLYLYNENKSDELNQNWNVVKEFNPKTISVNIGHKGLITSSKSNANEGYLITYHEKNSDISIPVGFGLSPRFLSDEVIVFIDLQNDKRNLITFNLKTKETETIYGNVYSYDILDDEIQIIQKSSNEGFFIVKVYNPERNTFDYLGESMLNNLNISYPDNVVYGDAFFSVNNKDKQIIYRMVDNK